jgi:hypothetical protein
VDPIVKMLMINRTLPPFPGSGTTLPHAAAPQ